MEQGIARQEALIDVVASRTDAAMGRLESIVEKDIASRALQKPMQLTLQVLGPDGSSSSRR